MRAYSLAVPLVEMGHEVTLIGSAMRWGLQGQETIEHGVRILQMGGVTPARVRNGGLDPADCVIKVTPGCGSW